MQNTVAGAALLLGLICFGLYVWEAIAVIRAKPTTVPSAVDAKAQRLVADPALSVDELSQLLEAASKLTDSLSKAGPALTSLIGAILFFAIAAISSGALHGSPPPATTASSAEARPSK